MNSRCFKFHRYITPLPVCQMSANFPGVEFLKTTSIACRRPLPSQTKKNQKEKVGGGGGGGEREREESISPICFRGGLVCTQATHRRSAKEQEKQRPFTSSAKRQVSLSCSDGKKCTCKCDARAVFLRFRCRCPRCRGRRSFKLP